MGSFMKTNFAKFRTAAMQCTFCNAFYRFVKRLNEIKKGGGGVALAVSKKDWGLMIRDDIRVWIKESIKVDLFHKRLTVCATCTNNSSHSSQGKHLLY